MRLPSGNFVEKDTPIFLGSNFTWGEATKNLTRIIEPLDLDGKQLMSAIEIEQRIINTAKYLNKVREILGNRPLTINSWYRPVKENLRVGGSRWSRHQFGDGVDFISHYLHPYKVYKLLNAWHGEKGGLGRYYSFTHLDLRGEKARWLS